MHPHSPPKKQNQSSSPLQRKFPQTARPIVSTTAKETEVEEEEEFRNNSEKAKEITSTALVVIDKKIPSTEQQQQQQKTSSNLTASKNPAAPGSPSSLLASSIKIPQNLPALSCWPAKPKNIAVGSNNNNNNSSSPNNNNRSLVLRVDEENNNHNNLSPTDFGDDGPVSLTSSKPALAAQLEKELSVKLSAKKSLPERVNIVADLLKKFAKMFPSYQFVMHAAIDVIHGFSGELSKEVVGAKDFAVASVREFQRNELRDAHALLIKEAEKRVALEAEVQTLKSVIATKIKNRENEVQIAHNETMKLIRRSQDEAPMEDEVKRLRLHVGQLATECAKLKLEVHKHELQKNQGSVRRLRKKITKSNINTETGKDGDKQQRNTNDDDDDAEGNNNNNDKDDDYEFYEEELVYRNPVRDIRETLPPAFIEASKHELEKSRMVMQREIIECAAGTNSAFRLKIGRLQRQVEELQTKLKESEEHREATERLSYERRYIRGTLPVDVFDAIKRDGLAKADEPLPRLRSDENNENTDFITPQELMRRDELSAISSCYTPRPFISYDVQTVLGIGLNGRTRDVVEQLTVVAVDLYEELIEIKKNNRKLYAASRWMSAQELDRIFEEDEQEAEREQREKNKLVLSSAIKMNEKSNNNNNSNDKNFQSNKNDNGAGNETEKNGFSLFDEDEQDRKTAERNERKNTTPAAAPNVSPPLKSLSLFQKMSSAGNNNNQNSSSPASSSKQTPTTISNANTLRVDGIIPTYSEREWPSIPHFLRTDVTLGILSKNWSAKETINFSIQILGLFPEATERARRLKDKFMIKPPIDVLTERRRSHLLPPLDATNIAMIGHQSTTPNVATGGGRNNNNNRPFVPVGYATTIALRMVAEKQLLYEWEEQNAVLMKKIQVAKQRSDDEAFSAQTQISSATSHLLGLNNTNTQLTSQTNFDKMMSASRFNESFAGASSTTAPPVTTTSAAANKNENPYYTGVDKIVNRAAIIRLATDYSYNWWDALHRYQETEPLCRLVVKILDGSLSLGVFDFYKKFMTELHEELSQPSADQHVQNQLSDILSSAATNNNNNNDSFTQSNNEVLQNNNVTAGKSHAAPTTASVQDNLLIWPEFAKRLAWKFSGSPIENLSRKAVFAAAKTVDFLHLTFADRLPVSKMLSLEVLLPQLMIVQSTANTSITNSPSESNTTKNNNDSVAFSSLLTSSNQRNASSTDSSSSSKRVSPLANALLAITLDAMQELFHLVYEKLEPCVKQSTFAEGVSVLNAGDALALAKEIDAGFLASKQTDFVKKVYEKMGRQLTSQQQKTKSPAAATAPAPSSSSAAGRPRNNNNKSISNVDVVNFAENLEVHASNICEEQHEETPESIQNFLLQSSSVSSLSFCARVYVRTALQMCMKLDGSIHKPREKRILSQQQHNNTSTSNVDVHETSLNSPSSNRSTNNSRKSPLRSRNDNNRDTVSPSSNASSPSKRKKSATATSRTAQNASKNSDRVNKNNNNNDGDDMNDNIPSSVTPESGESFGEFKSSPSAVLNDILHGGVNNKNGKDNNNNISKQHQQRRRRSSVKSLSNGQLTSTDLVHDMLFSEEKANINSKNEFSSEGNNNNNTSFYNEEEAAEQEVDDKMWVEWHEFISKLRRITPRPFTSEEILTNHSIVPI